MVCRMRARPRAVRVAVDALALVVGEVRDGRVLACALRSGARAHRQIGQALCWWLEARIVEHRSRRRTRSRRQLRRGGRQRGEERGSSQEEVVHCAAPHPRRSRERRRGPVGGHTPNLGKHAQKGKTSTRFTIQTLPARPRATVRASDGLMPECYATSHHRQHIPVELPQSSQRPQWLLTTHVLAQSARSVHRPANRVLGDAGWAHAKGAPVEAASAPAEQDARQPLALRVRGGDTCARGVAK